MYQCPNVNHLLDVQTSTFRSVIIFIFLVIKKNNIYIYFILEIENHDCPL